MLTPETAARLGRNQILLAVATSTAAVLSILELAFSVDAWNAWRFATEDGTDSAIAFLDPELGYQSPHLWQYPPSQQLYTSDGKITIASSITSLVVALLLGSMCIFVSRRSKALLLSKFQRLSLFGILLATCILAIANYAIRNIHRLESATLDTLDLVSSNENLSDGTFDLGVWSCQLRHYSSVFGGDGADLYKQCIEETVTLWLGLGLALLDVAILSIVWRDWRGGARTLLRNYDEVFECDYEIENFRS